MKNELVNNLMKVTTRMSETFGTERPNLSRIKNDSTFIIRLVDMFKDKETRRELIQTILKMMRGYRNEDLSTLFSLLTPKLNNEELSQIHEFVSEWEANGRNADDNSLAKMLDEGAELMSDAMKTKVESTLSKISADFDDEEPEDNDDICHCVKCRLKNSLMHVFSLVESGEKDLAKEAFMTVLEFDPDYESEQIADIIKASIYLELKHELDLAKDVTNFAYYYNTVYKIFDEDDDKKFAMAIIAASPLKEEGRQRILDAIRSDIFDHDNVSETGRWCRQAEINTGLVGFAKADELRDGIEFEKLVGNIMQFEDTFPECQEHFDRYKVIFDKVRNGELSLENL